MIQIILCLLPGVAEETRWAVLFYSVLPGSFLTPSLGKDQEEYAFASGVCSLSTLLCLAAFLVIAVLTV